MPHSGQGNASPYDLTFHRRNKLHLSSLVAVVAVAEAATAIVAVHRVKSATSVPVSSVLEGVQRRLADSAAPSPAVVTVLITMSDICYMSQASPMHGLRR